MTTSQDIDGLLGASEDEHLEFKAAENNFELDELVKYAVALSNEGGGRLVLGVTDKKPRRVVGTRALRAEDVAFRILQRIQLRVSIDAVDHVAGRVVVVTIPPRPLGQPVHDRGQYWVRSGESVVPMTQHQLKTIFDETRPDFSAEPLPEATRFDLDERAILRFRELWARKAGRPELLEGPWAQVLEDAELVNAGMPTVAAMILLGEERALGRLLPQNEIIFEFRDDPNDLLASKRIEFRRPVLLALDDLWSAINAFNKEEIIEDGFLKWNVPMFRERVVREALLNVVAHRNYRSQAASFIKQTPTELAIISPGGFPESVTAANILTRSVPRNRRLAEALGRCGLVERAGSGADLMFGTVLRDGKPPPDYSRTSVDEVVVELRGQVQDQHFIHFLNQLEKERDLSFTVADLVLLDAIARGHRLGGEQRRRAEELKAKGALEASGAGAGRKYLLASRFYALAKRSGEYTRRKGLARGEHELLLLKHLEQFGASSMSQLEEVIPSVDRRSILKTLHSLKDQGKVRLEGTKRGSKWVVAGQKPGESEKKSRTSAAPATSDTDKTQDKTRE